MLQKKSFVKKTRGGKVMKVVREHYLRDDIWSGSPLDPVCDPSAHKLSADAPHYLVIDTNVALHQMDFLEHPSITDVIVCRTVVEEVEHRNKAGGQRLRNLCQSPTKRFYVFSNEHHRDTYIKEQPGETPNDRNDRAIRVATKWYVDRLPSKPVILLTNDAANRAAAAAAGLTAMSLSAYARSRKDTPELIDLVARQELVDEELAAFSRELEMTDGDGGNVTTAAAAAAADAMDTDNIPAAAAAASGGAGAGAAAGFSRGGVAGPGPGSSSATAAAAAAGGGVANTTSSSHARSSKRKKLYAAHKTAAEVAAAVAAGRCHQGTLRSSRFNPFEGWVSSEAVGQDILISGRIDMNRAIDGDLVAVELLPESQWKKPSKVLGKTAAAADAAAAADGGGGEGGEDEDGSQHAAGGAGGEDDMPPVEIFSGPEAGGDTVSSSSSSKPGAAAAAGAARPTGRVVGIIKRNWRTRGYCGSLQPQELPPGSSTQALLVVPVDRRYPMIRIHTRQGAALMDKRIVVALDGWDADSMYPSGHYVRTLGEIGKVETETEVLLIENDINTSPFSPAVHECVPPLPWAVTESDLADAHREDLRHLCVCSVDPPGCKDIDDALHVRELPNGNLEVGVHIADVTHFVKSCTPIDREASSRATTTYLVDRRLDMLPKPLTEDICSLRGGVERLAFSALWEMTPEAEVVSTRFTKSVIASRAALTYKQAQERIDDASLNDEVTLGLRHLLRLSKILKARRTAAGALQLASPEVKFQLDKVAQEKQQQQQQGGGGGGGAGGGSTTTDAAAAAAAAAEGNVDEMKQTSDSMDMGMYQTHATNSMVEEMMLLANVSVAQAIVNRFPSCSLLRRHQTPEPRQFEPLLAAAASAGFALDTSSSKALADSLDGAVRPDDKYFNTLVRMMATRCMTQARYFGSGEVAPVDYYHYGLASPIYTHFTSPIRRYADVVVHRLLSAAIGIAPLPDELRDMELLHDCSDNLNNRHRNAQQAGRASIELYTLIYFYGKEVTADARVLQVKANGLVVFVPRYGIEGPVFLTDNDGNALTGGGGGAAATAAAVGSDGVQQQFVLDEDKQTVVAADGSVSYSVFDKCAVRIAVVEGAARRRSIKLALVPRSELAAEDIVG